MFFCQRCVESSNNELSATTIKSKDNGESSSTCCNLCLGLNQPIFLGRLQEAIESAAQPYYYYYYYNNKQQTDGQQKRLLFSRTATPPSIIVPGDLLYRRQKAIDDKKNLENFAHSIKVHAKALLLKCLDKIEKASNSRETPTSEENESIGPDASYPECVTNGELGYLAVHVILVPKDGLPRPDVVEELRAAANSKRSRNKRKLDGPQQGGDPRQNLENRIPQHVWTINQATNTAANQEIQKDLSFFDADNFKKGDNNDVGALDIHVAVWRRPFYLGSCYTKTRRDVSQTPFFVTENGKRLRLGVSSVEEQILPIIERYCNGISTLNNNSKGGEVQFGMAKFHASGREDLDVRMIVPSLASAEAPAKKISGRPFVCEIIDAFSMPSPLVLKSIVDDINHTQSTNTSSPGQEEGSAISYGCNPMGVGIANSLRFVSPDSFKTLQSQTEDKVKHYGCLCWSKASLPDSDTKLNELLGSFPLELKQRTPLRVLHRRSNMIRERHVLTCSATRVDDHYFRLHLSTDAGTYVKEFVHGDLGRTIPSVSKLLGCKTDILELDCEGIQAGD